MSDHIQADRHPAAAYWRDRAMRAEARVTEVEARWAEQSSIAAGAEERISALEAAARAVVDAASFSSNTFPLLCRICVSPDALHSPSCPVGALAALLEGEGQA